MITYSPQQFKAMTVDDTVYVSRNDIIEAYIHWGQECINNGDKLTAGVFAGLVQTMTQIQGQDMYGNPQ